MKKFLISSIVTILCLSALAQPSTLISGKWHREGTPSEISLFHIVYGRLERMATYYLQDDRAFSFAFSPTASAYYVIGTGNEVSKEHKYIFYLNPKDQLDFVVNDSTYTLIGNKNSKENIALKAWHDYFLPLELDNLPPWGRTTYVGFFPLLEDKLANPYKAQLTGNKAFDASFAKLRDLDMLWAIGLFPATPRTAVPKTEDFPDVYRTLNIEELTSRADILMFPIYRTLHNLIMADVRVNGTMLGSAYQMVDRIKNDTLKGEMFLSLIGTVNEHEVLDRLTAQYGKHLVTTDQKKRLIGHRERIVKLHAEQGTTGDMALNFTFQDIEGNWVSLSDFKGKVVYIDIWATWCGPCRKEFPHLITLKEKFKNRDDLVFMSISMDQVKQRAAWEKVVKDEALPGVQLFGREGKGCPDIDKLYQVTTIPRFFLIDQTGKIVSNNAPRPSSEEIVPMLTRVLR
jgi:thiol-disulfide isomerase/thioredoxin